MKAEKQHTFTRTAVVVKDEKGEVCGRADLELRDNGEGRVFLRQTYGGNRSGTLPGEPVECDLAVLREIVRLADA